MHGEVGGYLNDEIFCELVQSLQKFHQQQQSSSSSSTNSAESNSDFIVFEKLAEYFPDNGSAMETKEKFRSLMQPKGEVNRKYSIFTKKLLKKLNS